MTKGTGGRFLLYQSGNVNFVVCVCLCVHVSIVCGGYAPGFIHP